MQRAYLFILFTLYFIAIARSLLLIIAASIFALKKTPTEKSSKKEIFVSFIIPSHYLEKGISQNICSLLEASKEFQREVILVIDGDPKEIREEISSLEEKHRAVKVFTIPKSGKSAALNKGIKEANGDIIVLTDVDDRWGKSSLEKLIFRFSDSKVEAVGGHVFLGKSSGLPHHLQEIEFLNFFIYRMAASLWKGATIAGGIGAFRKNLLKQKILFNESNMEDVDTSLNLLKDGVSISCEPGAIVYTSGMPPTFISLLKQRIRWYVGFCQLTNHHLRDILFKGVSFKLRLKCLWHLFNLYICDYFVLAGYFLSLTISMVSKNIGIIFSYWAIMTANIFFYLLIGKRKFKNNFLLPNITYLLLYAIFYYNLLLGLRIVSLFIFLAGINLNLPRDYPINADINRDQGYSTSH